MTFVSLQALRGLAALGVVLFHLLPFEAKYLPGGSIVPPGFSAGRAGVDLFFVLSGFLAVLTTRGRAGAGAAQRFLLHRVTRIYPTYWFYCIPLVLAEIASPGGLIGQHRPDVVASLLLIANAAPPLLLVAWTLEFEIYFYLVFALLVCARLSPRERVLALLAWGGIVAIAHGLLAPTRGQAVLDAVLSPLVFEFLAGCAAAYLCAGIPRAMTAVAGSMGCAVLAIGLVWSEALFGLPWLRVAVFGSGAALLLIGCFGADAFMRRALPGVVVRIGDASYSLYLSHLFTIGAVGHVMSRLPPSARLFATPAFHVVALCIAVLATLLVAELSYRWVECPLLRVSRYLIKPPASPRTAPAA
jgi:exopolysaccharide production protein ExoZ